ncbi:MULTISPECIES: LysR family transcriptional regulator [Neisseria]|uniref:LysR family transcriptional regulator n=1 Tax=Neisseria TaxID=482 RepID=UPI000E595D5F|nr:MULTISPECIES: LysR family transcriptional regulator [Neisseria]
MQNRNFNDLYAFIQVVKLGNFSRAAQSLGVQPSALSHRMNDLENRLNTKLLNRTTRSMSPTEAGQRLYERIAPMFGGIQEELAALGDLHGKVSGRLRINTAENPVYYLIYPKVRSFLAQFPEVDVEILINNSWSNIVAQGFDFGVRPLGDVAQDMVAVPISGERAMCVVAAPDYLTRHGQPETPSELVQHRCIVPASLTFNSTALVKTAALDGLGLTWLPHYAVADELASGALVELFARARAVYPPMALYYPPNRHKTQAAEALIEWLKIEKVV